MTIRGDRRRQERKDKYERRIESERNNYHCNLTKKITAFAGTIATASSIEGEDGVSDLSTTWASHLRSKFDQLSDEFAIGVNKGIFTREHVLGRLVSFAQFGADKTKPFDPELGSWFDTQVSALTVAVEGELPSPTLGQSPNGIIVASPPAN